MKSPRNVRLAMFAMAVFGGEQTGFAAALYSFSTIDFPGAASTVASGINNSGQIVGSFTDAVGEHGFLYSGGSFASIDFPGATSTQALGVNDGGQIVGSSTSAAGFIYAGGNFTTIGVPGAADAINDDGQVVGSYLSGIVRVDCFLYTGGSFTTLPHYIGHATECYGINDSGQIVGGNGAGFLYSGGSYTAIMFNEMLTLPTWAKGINDAGEIVGYYTDASGGLNGFDYSGVSFTAIDVPGATDTQALGINDSGQIVGTFSEGGVSHGFLATPLPEPLTVATSLFALFAMARRLQARKAARSAPQWT